MSSHFKKELRKKIHKKYNYKCAYCGVTLEYKDLQVDHINPKYRGYSNEELKSYGITRGRDDLNNLNPSCASCNSSKSTYTLEDWRTQIKLKIDRERKNSSNFRILERFMLIRETKNDVIFFFEYFNNN